MDVLQLNTSTGRVQQVALTGIPANALETEVWNESGATILKGSVVYINGAHGNLPTIALSLADNDFDSSKTYGLVVSDISDNDNGFVVHSGLLSNLNTFGIAEGVSLWLSPTTAGAYTTTKPTAPDHAVFIGVCTRAHPTFGTIEVTIQNGYELEELHNVSINGTLADKDMLYYESATSLWKNVAYGANDISVLIYLSNNGTSHPHTCFLTYKEANDLMMGTVASVTKDSSVFGTHIHSVTVVWDITNRTFSGTSTLNAGHTHGDIVTSPQSVYGSQYQIAESLTESTTGSTAFQTKVTLTTTSLPLGNYRVEYTFGTSNSGGKEMQVEFRRSTTRLRLMHFQNGYAASAGQYTAQGGFNNFTAISGVQTFDIRYAAPSGGTTRIGDAKIVIYRTL